MIRNSIFTLLTLYTPVTFAYSIQDAIIDAHENNYAIMAQLETFKAVEMDKPIAIAEFMPRASLQGQATQNNNKYQPAKTYASQNHGKYQKQKALVITQPLFSGGSSIANYMTIDNKVSAAEANFKGQSAQISLDVVQAYEAVVSSQNILDLSIENLNLSTETLEYTKTRFEHGEVTKTDVLQAESNYADSIASKEKATGDLHSAKATLERIIGHSVPDKLMAIEYNKIEMPKNLDEVIEVANKNNYLLISAKFEYEASKYNVLSATSAILPSVSANASINNTSIPKDYVNNTSGVSYTLSVNIPILAQGGAEYAKIVQTQHNSNSVKYQYQETERKVKENSISLWSSYKSNLAQVKSRLEAIQFYEKALEGVREEAKVGTRTTLDVLTSQQNLFKAQVNYKNTERDLVNSIYSLLCLMSLIDTIDVKD